MSNLIDVVVPLDQQEGTESVVGRWMKQVGESCKQHEPLLEINTDKVVVEISAPCNGVLKEIVCNENDKISPGTLLGRIEAGATADVVAKSPAKSANSAAAKVGSGSATELSPAVKKLLKEHNLAAGQITGTGKDGRITHQDVMNYVARAGGSATPTCAGGKLASKHQKHDQMRRAIAQHMVGSMATAPHVTSVFELDMSAVVAHRDSHKGEFEKQGVKLTFTPYFVVAAAAALKAVPEVNSRWHDDSLEVFDDCNIGVATALEGKGLIVPVIKGAQKMDLSAATSALHALVSKARAGQLEPREVQDGTFTISNHGVSGSLLATPIIINQPQSAILGIGKLEQRVVVLEKNGRQEFVARPMCYVTLTIDHRVLDGYRANQFLTVFVDTLQQWR